MLLGCHYFFGLGTFSVLWKRNNKKLKSQKRGKEWIKLHRKEQKYLLIIRENRGKLVAPEILNHDEGELREDHWLPIVWKPSCPDDFKNVSLTEKKILNFSFYLIMWLKTGIYAAYVIFKKLCSMNFFSFSKINKIDIQKIFSLHLQLIWNCSSNEFFLFKCLMYVYAYLSVAPQGMEKY